MANFKLYQKTFDELFDLYYEKLTVFVYSFVNDREVARDIVHDLFLNLWKNRGQLDPARSLKSYLYTIARNRSLDFLKHRRVMETNIKGLVEEFKNSEEDWEEIERRMELVREKLTALSEKQYEVIIKCCVEGKMYKEVATELNISENTVKTHLTRALRLMREGLKGDMIFLFMLQDSRAYQSLSPDFKTFGGDSL